MRNDKTLKKKWLLFLLIVSLVLPVSIGMTDTSITALAATTNTTSTTLTLTVGDTATLRLSGVTSGVTWKSSNKKVVSVTTSGKITAKKKGVTSIIATYNGHKYKWVITVKNSLATACKTGDTSGLSGTDLKVVNKVTSIIDNNITDDMTDYEKIKTIHDYIILNCSYDKRATTNISSMPNASYHPEGCLLYNTCVCQGYAETFQLFMNALGIKNKLITGDATDAAGNTNGHAWNSVKLNGKWFNIDLTFDDPLPDAKGLVRYTYFLRNDAFFEEDHIWDDGNYPSCTSTSYLMKPYKEYIVSNEQEAKESFLEQRADGNTYYTFVYKSNSSIDFDFLFDYSTGSKKGYSSYSPDTRGSYTIFIAFFS